MAYPTSILNLTNPIASNTLNSPDHAGLHTALANDLTQVESVLGLQNSTDVNSITYQVQNPSSPGGGHVQGAAYGGTGQTYYNKGDILVGMSASVVGRQAAGPTGYAVIYDPTQTNGLNSALVLTGNAIQNQSATFAVASVLSASVYGAQITPIPSVLTKGQAFQIQWPNTNTSSLFALSISSIVAVPVITPYLTYPPIGAIQSSMVSIVEYDGANFQLVSIPAQINSSILTGTLPALSGANLTNLPNTNLYANGTTTKNASDASTAQNIAHGLGKTPKYVKISASLSGTEIGLLAQTTYNGTTQSSFSNMGFASNYYSTQTFQIGIDGSANYSIGVVTFNSTNIIITWTKNGGPSSAIFNIMWEAQG